MGQRAVILLCLLAVVAASDRPKRLTAFGKAPSQDPSPIPQGKGRECKSQEECEAVPYTSCLYDSHSRKRCLCKDRNPPLNGQCAVKVRGLRQTCNRDDECLDGGECKIDRNSTSHSNNKGKVCLCRVGHVEIDNQCSGVDSLMPSLTLAALVLLLTASTFNIN